MRTEARTVGSETLRFKDQDARSVIFSFVSLVPKIYWVGWERTPGKHTNNGNRPRINHRNTQQRRAADRELVREAKGDPLVGSAGLGVQRIPVPDPVGLVFAAVGALLRGHC